MGDLVSVIMPAYNTESYIGDAIASVLKQTYTNWELLVVDDASTDQTAAVVISFHDPRIKYLKMETNSGAALCRNRALSEAKGHWVAFLDSDDTWHPEKLEKQIAFMENNHFFFSYTEYTEYSEEKGREVRLWSGPLKIGKKKMRFFNFMGCLTVMYDREYVGLIQVENLKKRNDYAMWLHVVKQAPAYLLQENLAVYHVRKKGNLTKKALFSPDKLKYTYRLWRIGEHQNVLTATILTLWNIVGGVYKKIKYQKKIERKI